MLFKTPLTSFFSPIASITVTCIWFYIYICIIIYIRWRRHLRSSNFRTADSYFSYWGVSNIFPKRPEFSLNSEWNELTRCTGILDDFTLPFSTTVINKVLFDKDLSPEVVFFNFQRHTGKHRKWLFYQEVYIKRFEQKTMWPESWGLLSTNTTFVFISNSSQRLQCFLQPHKKSLW